jgi:hypothetical protein
MDCKERGSRKGNKSKKTGRQHCKHGSNNCSQETNLLHSPKSKLQSNSPVKSSHPNLQLWENLLHKHTLPAKKEELKTAKNGRSFPIVYFTDTTDITSPSNFTPMILKKIKQDKFQLYLPNLTDRFGNVIDCDGDNGLDNTWGYYHKYPDANFLLAIGMDDVQEMSPPNLSDDGVQGKDFGNKATLPAASDGAGNDDTMLVDNDAQDHTDEEKQANSNEESDTETEEKDDDKSSSSGLQNLWRGLGVTGMVKRLVYQHKILPTKKTPRHNVVTSEWIYHGIFTLFMRHHPVDDLDEYRKAIYFSLGYYQQSTKTMKITPCMKLNNEVATWSQKLKTVSSSHNHDNNVGDDGLSAQSTYSINISDSNYIASLTPNEDLLKKTVAFSLPLEKFYSFFLMALNEVRHLITSKMTLSSSSPQGKIINTTIAQIDASKVVPE